MMKPTRPFPLHLLPPLLLVAVVVLVAWIAATVWATYEPTVQQLTVSYDLAGASADVNMSFDVPSENLLFDELITFYPPQWGIAAGNDVDVGTVVGEFSMDTTVGLLNGACSSSLPASCGLLNSATSPLSGTILDTDDMFDPVCPGGRERAVCQWPDFLSELFPDSTPRARYYCHSGSSFVNILVFEPGTSLYGVDFPADWGYGSVTVIGDPSALEGTPPTPNPITDLCAPLGIFETINGTAGAAVPIRTNPSQGGSYTFRVWSRGALDGDGDGYENAIDTCPLNVNADASPRTPLGDPDGDGIDSVCDPQPGVTCWSDAPGLFNDCDGDWLYNRGDNCPLIANEDQVDADGDRIGDACDPNPDDPFGYPGQDFTNELEVEISGPEPASGETPTLTVSPSPTPGVAGTPTPAMTGTPISGTGTVGPGEGCAPVIPATYNGLVRLNGVPAASGHEIIASIGGTEWGSAIVSGGRYAIDVPEKLPTGEPCFVGDTVAFFVDGAPCTPVVQKWSSGLHDVDLSCVTVATPTPAAPTPPPTSPTTTAPTATPAKPPSSGGGGLGGDQGVPLWALTLAGWGCLLVLGCVGVLARRSVRR
jgi:hypothetical protein